jgi:signal transduction histidine kinase
VTINLKDAGKALELTIEDDGKGFDPANTDSYNGNGLPNMHVRAEAIGAVFSIESSPGNGTRARITVPHHVLTPRSGD